MNTFYLDKIKISRGELSVVGYHFHSINDDGYVYLTDGRVKDFAGLNNPVVGLKIEILESKKLNPVSEIVIISNGRNNPLIRLDLKNKEYRGKRRGGNYGDDASIPYMLSHALMLSIDDDIKQYKIDGLRII